MEYIYLDHNATTPIRPEVVEAMARCWSQGYANAASQHQAGQKARRVVEEARERIAALLGADTSGPRPDRLIFTSGGTESNNLAILGIARARCPSEAGRIVISSVEHASVIEPAERLMEEGWRLDSLEVGPEGVVRVDRLPPLLTPKTALVSVLLGNHETGAMQPIEALAGLCNEAGVPLHTDAVQVVGKLPVSFRRLGVAAMTVAAHKFQGPLGIGALLVRHDVPVEPLLFGGHQQQGIRPGTEPVPLVVGMLRALELWHQDWEAHARRLTALRDRFEAGLVAGHPDTVVNARGAHRLPQTSSIALPGLDAQVLVMALDIAGVGCSVGSACSSGSTELSPTLLAMGLPKAVVASTLRFSLGGSTTDEEVEEAVRRILHVVRELRS